ncbi:hypothetical protein [Cryptosporangium sp. NPDC051539]|uniref:hypothetical protein n=1 Tax=Cryptosporangium sp. NPDC051539 TaxID=3363962 RepID=UPI0037B928C9
MSVRGIVVKVAVVGILVVGSLGFTAGTAQAGTCRNWQDLASAFRDLFIYDAGQSQAAGSASARSYWDQQAQYDFANWKFYEGRYNTCNAHVP